MACSKDQQHLSDALEMALGRQLEFERHYRDQLLSVSADLISVYSDIKDRQAKSAQLAELAKASTIKMGDAVGGAIVSLQAGDSARQRLEHIFRGFRGASGGGAGIAPRGHDENAAPSAAAPPLCLIPAPPLKETITRFRARHAGIRRPP